MKNPGYGITIFENILTLHAKFAKISERVKSYGEAGEKVGITTKTKPILKRGLLL